MSAQKIARVSKTLIQKKNRWSESKYYAIVGGKNGFTGVVDSWDTCGKLVLKVKNVRYKSFASKEEAEQFVKQVSGREEPPCFHSSRKDPSIRYDQSSSSKGQLILHLYTDGACISNGTCNAKAGYGVYFGEEDPRNISKPLLGKVQTNQRAELSAMIAALESLCKEPIIHEPEAQVYVYTDSRYVKNILTAGWLEQWKKNDWKRKGLGQVKNLDLIQRLDYLWNNIKLESKGKIEIVWVKGHDGLKGNEEADRLATKGIYKVESENKT